MEKSFSFSFLSLEIFGEACTYIKESKLFFAERFLNRKLSFTMTTFLNHCNPKTLKRLGEKK